MMIFTIKIHKNLSKFYLFFTYNTRFKSMSEKVTQDTSYTLHTICSKLATLKKVNKFRVFEKTKPNNNYHFYLYTESQRVNLVNIILNFCINILIHNFRFFKNAKITL